MIENKTDRVNGRVVRLVCDKCQEHSSWFPTEDFIEMINEAKSDHWIVYKEEQADEWKHLCPDCKWEMD